LSRYLLNRSTDEYWAVGGKTIVFEVRNDTLRDEMPADVTKVQFEKSESICVGTLPDL